MEPPPSSCWAGEEVRLAHSQDQARRTSPLYFGKFLPEAETDTALGGLAKIPLP